MQHAPRFTAQVTPFGRPIGDRDEHPAVGQQGNHRVDPRASIRPYRRQVHQDVLLPQSSARRAQLGGFPLQLTPRRHARRVIRRHRGWVWARLVTLSPLTRRQNRAHGARTVGHRTTRDSRSSSSSLRPDFGPTLAIHKHLFGLGGGLAPLPHTLRRPQEATTDIGHHPSDVAQATPTRWATAAASIRLVTPSLRRMLDTWTLAVFSETYSSAPISRFVLPAATRARTSASRDVRPSRTASCSPPSWSC